MVLITHSPLKRWLQEHGFNPYPKARKQQPPSHRNLQPFTFDSPFPSPSGIPPTPQIPTKVSNASSALDNLFTKFIHKQEQDLAEPGQSAIKGGDEKGGLERLFGNIDVLKEEAENAEKRREEDEELALLLGGVAVEPVKVVSRQQPASSKASKLLSLLNTPPPMVPSPKIPRPALQPHQSSLLAVLSPERKPPSPALVTTPPNLLHEVLPTPSIYQQVEPTSISSLSQAPAVIDRERKQKALLDQIAAGVDFGTAAFSAHRLDPFLKSNGNVIPYGPPAAGCGPSLPNGYQPDKSQRHQLDSLPDSKGNAFPHEPPPMIHGFTTPASHPPDDRQRHLLGILGPQANSAPFLGKPPQLSRAQIPMPSLPYLQNGVSDQPPWQSRLPQPHLLQFPPGQMILPREHQSQIYQAQRYPPPTTSSQHISTNMPLPFPHYAGAGPIMNHHFPPSNFDHNMPSLPEPPLNATHQQSLLSQIISSQPTQMNGQRQREVSRGVMGPRFG